MYRKYLREALAKGKAFQEFIQQKHSHVRYPPMAVIAGNGFPTKTRIIKDGPFAVCGLDDKSPSASYFGDDLIQVPDTHLPANIPHYHYVVRRAHAFVLNDLPLLNHAMRQLDPHTRINEPAHHFPRPANYHPHLTTHRGSHMGSHRHHHHHHQHRRDKPHDAAHHVDIRQYSSHEEHLNDHTLFDNACDCVSSVLEGDIVSTPRADSFSELDSSTHSSPSSRRSGSIAQLIRRKLSSSSFGQLRSVSSVGTKEAEINA